MNGHLRAHSLRWQKHCCQWPRNLLRTLIMNSQLEVSKLVYSSINTHIIQFTQLNYSTVERVAYIRNEYNTTIDNNHSTAWTGLRLGINIQQFLYNA